MGISVAFVDDHPLLLEGLVSLYSKRSGIDVVGKGENAVDALKLVEEFNPNVVVVDLSLPGNAISAIKIILQRYPKTRVIAFTASTSVELAIHVLSLGVSGYVLKGSTSSDLLEAIQTAHAGGTFITPGFATTVIMSMKADALRRKKETQRQLSIREEQIVGYLMRGSSNREIANCLKISEKTVKYYMTALMQKLQAKNRLEVVLAAQQRNLGHEADLPAAHWHGTGL